MLDSPLSKLRVLLWMLIEDLLTAASLARRALISRPHRSSNTSPTTLSHGRFGTRSVKDAPSRGKVSQRLEQRSRTGTRRATPVPGHGLLSSSSDSCQGAPSPATKKSVRFPEHLMDAACNGRVSTSGAEAAAEIPGATTTAAVAQSLATIDLDEVPLTPSTSSALAVRLNTSLRSEPASAHVTIFSLPPALPATSSDDHAAPSEDVDAATHACVEAVVMEPAQTHRDAPPAGAARPQEVRDASVATRVLALAEMKTLQSTPPEDATCVCP